MVLNSKKYMTTLKNSLLKSLCVILLLFIVTSCKDETDEALNLSRQFSPGDFDIKAGETSVAIEWNASLFTIEGDVEYAFELSKDATFATVEFETTTTERSVTITDSEFAIKTDYYARVKAVGKDGSEDSNWSVSKAFKILGEQFLLPVADGDVIDNKAIMHWKVKPNLTKIVFTAGDQSVDVVLSEGDLDAGQKLISDLKPGTSYTAEIFQGELSKGIVSFTTKTAVSGNIIDLRGIVGKPKILLDTLPDIASGSVVLLKRGSSYSVATSYSFDKSVTILSGLDFGSDLATIRLESNFSIAAGSAIDSIVFKDVVFKGVRATGGSYNSDYIINTLSSVSPKAKVGKFRLDNCVVKILRGVVRVQAGGAGVEIENYFVNKCQVDSIREYGVAAASGLSFFKNISITNSTFNKLRRVISHTVAGNSSLKIQDCTFHNAPSNGAASANYFIDFNAANSGNPIVLKGVIVGKVWDELGTAPISGYRAGASTSISVADTYVTSDFTVVSPIPGVSPYSGASTALFVNSATGDFKIKDNAFAGRTTAGDPRWRP